MANETDGWGFSRREATTAGEVAYEVFGEVAS